MSAVSFLTAIGLGVLLLTRTAAAAPSQTSTPPPAPVDARTPFPFESGARVAWIGSSSTHIGVWPRTMEFLLRTRHPDRPLTFRRFTTGGGTFATALEKMDEWLTDFRPTLVIFNYGGNDSTAGEAGLPAFRKNMAEAVARAEAAGARVLLMTHQPSDPRFGSVSAQRAGDRARYAEEMIACGREHGWTVIDTYHRLEAMLKVAQADDPAFTILKDPTHLNDAGYVAWTLFLYRALTPPEATSAATVSADGRTVSATRCRIENVRRTDDTVSFDRCDEILPILPPLALPPRKHVPLEETSRYLLAVPGLPKGRYTITVDGKPIGTADADALAAGVNLNSLLLESGHTAPWAGLAEDIYNGKSLDSIGQTRWRFEVRPAPAP